MATLRKATVRYSRTSIRSARPTPAIIAATATNNDGRRRSYLHCLASNEVPPPRCTVPISNIGSIGSASTSASWSHGSIHNSISNVPSSSFSSYASLSSPDSPSKSFKKAIRPFLRACHPDAMASVDAADEDTINNKRNSNRLSQRAKSVNLHAVQTINGLIDILDDLIGRCTPPSYATSTTRSKKEYTRGAVPELKARYEIEFILPTIDKDGDTKPMKRKHRDKVPLTLRSITVSFPQELRSNVREWALTVFPSMDAARLYTDPTYSPSRQEEEAYSVAMQLRNHALHEFLRLLRVAGMEPPSDFISEQSSFPHGSNNQQQLHGGNQRKDETQWTLSDHFLHELGIDPMENDDATAASDIKTMSPAFFGRTVSQPSAPLHRGAKAAPPTYAHPHLQRQRESFIKSIPWNKFEQDYDNALKDAKADWTTERLDLYNVNSREGRERREKFVAQICGSVRIWRAQLDDGEEDENNNDELDDIPEGLDVVAQLIAIRRLSLLLYENFDYLRMEKMGRMWEQLVIVLTPPRKGLGSQGSRQRKLRDDGTPVHPGRKWNKWERRKRARERLQPVSRGRMRHVADRFLAPDKHKDIGNNDTSTAKDNDQDEALPYLTESGFKFSYGTQSDQGTGHVTAYIPVDFRDGELVKQLYTHVYDYFDNCCGHSAGFLRFGMDGRVGAHFEDGDGGDVRGSNRRSGGGSGRGRGGNGGSRDSNDEKDEKRMGAEE